MCLSNNTDFPTAELYLESQGVDLSIPYALRSFVKSAAKQGNTGAVSALLPQLDDITKNKALVRAAFGGHIQLLHLLLNNGANPLYNNSEALRVAAKHSHAGALACIQALIPVSDPLAKKSRSLSRAARLDNNVAILKVLLPFSDNHHVALENAAWFGCFENVEFLLSSGQCGNNHIQALSFAVYKSMGTLEEETKSSYEKIITKLWPFSDLDNLYIDVIEEAFYRKNQKWIDFCWPKFFANLQSQKKASDLDHWTAVRAAQNGYTDFLQQMLPFIDASVWDDYILHQAAKCKQWDCVKILIDLYDGDWAEIASWIVLYGQFHLFEELKIPFDRHRSEGAQEIWQSVGQEAQSIHVQDLFEHQDFSNAVYFLLGLLPTNHDALIQELLNLMPEILEDFGLRSKIVKLNHQVAFSIYQEKFPHDPYWSDFIMAALQYANIDILNNVLSKYPNRWENKWIAEAQTNKNSEGISCFARLIQGKDWDDINEYWILKALSSGFAPIFSPSLLGKWMKDEVKLKKMAYKLINDPTSFSKTHPETEMILDEAFSQWSDEEKQSWCQAAFEWGRFEVLPFLEKQKEDQRFWKKIYDFSCHWQSGWSHNHKIHDFFISKCHEFYDDFIFLSRIIRAPQLALDWAESYDPQKDGAHIFLKLCDQELKDEISPDYEKLWGVLFEKCKANPFYAKEGFVKTIKAQQPERSIKLLPYVNLDEVEHLTWHYRLCYKNNVLWELCVQRLSQLSTKQLLNVFEIAFTVGEVEQAKTVLSHLKVRSMGEKLIQDWAQGSAARECFNSKTLVIFKELEKENYFSKMVNQWVKDRYRLHKTIASKPERAEDTAYIECLKSWIRNEHLIKKDWTEEPLLPTLFIEVEKEVLRQEVSWANLPSNGNIVRL